MDSELTLEKAKQLVRQCEAVQKQQIILQHGEKLAETSVSYVKTDRSSSSRRPKTSAPPQRPQQRPQQQRSQKCTRCGKGPHPRGTCPAKEAICHKCKKKGHYSALCFSKSVAEVTTQPVEDYEVAYLNTIVTGNLSSWTATIAVNNQSMTFKLDTGAEVTAIMEEMYPYKCQPRPYMGQIINH